jgi:hypothetical protein
VRPPLPSRKAVGVAAMTLVVSSLGMTAGVFVARPAAASSSATTTTRTTTTTATGTGTGTTALASPSGSNPAAAKYFVINGTVHAASDHEIVGSSAFPNYATGAVDNYYSMAHSHVDNSPFAQGTASPADTGPIGQTAAAGNTQQPQYADARWPGNSGKATYGSQGGPYAIAEASEYRATAESSEASSGLNGPSGSSEMATPKGFNGRLQQALAAWKEKWQGRLRLKAQTGAVKTPTPTVTTPAVTVTTPAATVTTPTVTVGGLPVTPPVSVPLPAVPSAAAPRTAVPSRSTSSASTAPADGASFLESSSLATLDPKTGALVTSGESRLGRVSLGGGQIVIEGIHVSAKITNDGTPTEKVAISVGAASIGGVPVTIDQDGVHVAGQGQGLPYQQASDALNGALKQAGIQLFMVAPEIKTNSCDQTGTANGTTATTTNSSGQTGTNTTTTSSGQTGTTTGTTTTNSCDQTDMNSTTSSCGQTGTTTGTTTTNSSVLPGTTTGTTTTNSGDQTGTNSTTSSCDQAGTTTTTSSCDQTGTTTTTTSSGQTGTTTATTTTSSGLPGTSTTTSSGDGTGTATGSGEETVTATGLHVVFTQPVSQSGVPAQYAEHILGEVFLDSLAVPAGPLPDLNLNLPSSSCPNGRHSGKTKTSGGASKGGGGSSAGGSSSSSSPSASSSSSGSSQPAAGFTASGSQPTSSSTGTAPQSFPARLASALRKPMWLLLAYLLWQALVIATGASMWAWRRDGAS